MEETLENLETESFDSGNLPKQFKTLSVLSHVGNGIWGLLILITMLALISDPMAIVGEIPELRRLGQEGIDYMIIACGLLLVMIVLSLVGVLMMSKGKKAGFILYAISNGLWSLLLILGMSPIGIITGLAGIGFIVGFSKHSKQMK